MEADGLAHMSATAESSHSCWTWRPCRLVPLRVATSCVLLLAITGAAAMALFGLVEVYHRDTILMSRGLGEVLLALGLYFFIPCAGLMGVVVPILFRRRSARTPSSWPRDDVSSTRLSLPLVAGAAFVLLQFTCVDVVGLWAMECSPAWYVGSATVETVWVVGFSCVVSPAHATAGFIGAMGAVTSGKLIMLCLLAGMGRGPLSLPVAEARLYTALPWALLTGSVAQAIVAILALSAQGHDIARATDGEVSSGRRLVRIARPRSVIVLLSVMDVTLAAVSQTSRAIPGELLWGGDRIALLALALTASGLFHVFLAKEWWRGHQLTARDSAFENGTTAHPLRKEDVGRLLSGTAWCCDAPLLALRTAQCVAAPTADPVGAFMMGKNACVVLLATLAASTTLPRADELHEGEGSFPQGDVRDLLWTLSPDG